jgi:hypothetical protein
MSMDAQLAEIYGTGQEANAEDDQVKLAAAELLVKLAGDNNVDLSQFSDQEVAEMVQELQKEAELPPQFQKKEESGEEKKETPESKESGESSSESPEDKKAEAAEKVAEADFLGRVMAHSFAQECKEIEKEAGLKDKAVGAAKNVAKKGKASFLNLIHGKKDGAIVALKNHPKSALGGAAALGAAGGAAAMHKKKEGSADQAALDALAEQRALAMAKEAGWVDPEGNLVAPPAKEETKTASPLDLAVERRALEMLEANGYPVTWNE